MTLAQAYADVREGEVWLIGAEIAEYAQGNVQNHEPTRDRKLLLHRGEIASLIGKVREKGQTIDIGVSPETARSRSSLRSPAARSGATSGGNSSSATPSGTWSAP